jgi:hypothetical protein
VAGGALLGIGALVIFAVAKNEPPQAGLAPSAVPQPALAIDASPPLDSERRDTFASAKQTGDVAVAEKQTKAMDEPPKAMNEKGGNERDGQGGEDAAEMGTVLLPPRAAGHRIFVDGRRAKSDGEAPLRLRCGSHVIQIGSSGEPETIDLPCRGEVQLQ